MVVKTKDSLMPCECCGSEDALDVQNVPIIVERYAAERHKGSWYLCIFCRESGLADRLQHYYDTENLPLSIMFNILYKELKKCGLNTGCTHTLNSIE